MPYLNNHFHVYDKHKRIMFQIIGKSNFIRWINNENELNNKLVSVGRYKYFSTYTEMKQYLKDNKKDWKSYRVIDEEENYDGC
tara:strand:+ start:298 stop:546 length:249 start_codon:yes stop_codon:yes gene_type:complete